MSFFSNWGCYVVSITKSVSKEIGALICSLKFLFPKDTLDIFKSTILHCIEYCMFGQALLVLLDMLDKLKMLDKVGYVGLLIQHLLPL